MSSPADESPSMIENDLVRSPELHTSPNIIYIYAPAIYGVEAVIEELKEKLQHNFDSICGVEDDEDQVNVIKGYYYGDEADIDENEVLDVVRGFDGSAHITSY